MLFNEEATSAWQSVPYTRFLMDNDSDPVFVHAVERFGRVHPVITAHTVAEMHEEQRGVVVQGRVGPAFDGRIGGGGKGRRVAGKSHRIAGD